MRDLSALSCTPTTQGAGRAAQKKRSPNLPRAASWAPEVDYCTSRLSRLLCSAPYLAAAVAAWQQHCCGRKGVAFAVDIAHSQALAAAFVVRRARLHAALLAMVVSQALSFAESRSVGGTPGWNREQGGAAARPSCTARWRHSPALLREPAQRRL